MRAFFSKIYIFKILFIFAAFSATTSVASDDFLVAQFRIATALDSGLPIGIARWRSPVTFIVSGDVAKDSTIEEIKLEMSEISMATGIEVRPINKDNAIFDIHYFHKNNFDENDIDRFSKILQKKDLSRILKNLNNLDAPCFVQVKVVNNVIVGAVLFVDAELRGVSKQCMRANIISAFGFPMYLRMDKKINSVMTGNAGENGILTKTDIKFLSALYSEDPVGAINNIISGR